MNADDFNRLFPVGQRVVAYPGGRQADGLRTMTRTTAWTTDFGKDVVMVEGRSAWIALTHVDPICGSQCPTHDHVCLRSPKHCSNCRDEKQKGTESCDWDPRQISAAVKGLARLVATVGDGCWIMRTHDNCALIVPEGERLACRRTFKRPTVDVAVRLGLVELGAELLDVPEFAGCPPWLRDFAADPRDGRIVLQGCTIRATGGAK